MKTLTLILSTLLLICFAGASSGEVILKKTHLKYQDVRTTDGGELYETLCASCHGSSGKGDGPAAPALTMPVADLTILSTNNDGIFPHQDVEKTVYGNSRVLAHGIVDMPRWGDQLMDLRPDWSSLQRKSFTDKRIHNLAAYIEDMQSQ
jgi:mono/diheme cytochrome c family protein